MIEHICAVCGSSEYSSVDVLWDELIVDWELSPKETDYINKQQGCCCIKCGSNLRSIALASAILTRYKYRGTLEEFVTSTEAGSISVLEINEAGALTPKLEQLPNYVFASFPTEDMTKLSFENKSYDLVVHSDTLEHVDNPIRALSECRRILRDGGACIFTVPIIKDRMSRSREGLKDSYHGIECSSEFDYRVQTEFGADFWAYAIKAGFSNVTLHSFEFPSALAIITEL
jgi:SAM-dependent methyltransferase